MCLSRALYLGYAEDKTFKYYRIKNDKTNTKCLKDMG